MKSNKIAIVAAAAALSGVLSVSALVGHGQAQTDEQAKGAAAAKEQALRAKRLAQQFEANARVLTVFDRQGKVVTTVSERAIYTDPIFSPDRTRLAVIKSDLEADTLDLWVLDVASGNSTRITANKTRRQERTRWPVWSPDGSQVAYVALRAGYWGLYRKASDGTGTEELLYRHPGVINTTDWSQDGRFLHFHATDLSGGTLYALPLDGTGERKPIEVYRNEFQLRGSRPSPDSRFLAYQSNQSGRDEVYVRPFDPSAKAGMPSVAGPWQVSQGIQGSPAFWRRDGKEMYYIAADRGVMALEVSTAPTFTLGKPKLLFRLSEAIPVNGATASVSRDGQRVVIAVHPRPTLRQITMFDRQGHLLTKVGPVGRYRDPALSPDGTKVAVVRLDPRTNNQDIWTFDIASGKGTPVTDDTFVDNSPTWSSDGRQLAYVSTRGSFDSIYRKASDGTGNEEQLFQYTPGGSMRLTDWSPDGRFLTFHDGCQGVVHVLALGGDQKALERKAIEWLRDEFNVAQGRFSPDARLLAYLSNQSKTTEEINAGVFEVYVRPFDASRPEGGAGGAKPLQVSTSGARGMIFWRQDGKEMYYLTSDWEVMAVDVTTAPALQAGTPRLLFKLPKPVGGGPEEWKNVSRDGQRFVFTIDVPAPLAAR